MLETGVHATIGGGANQSSYASGVLRLTLLARRRSSRRSSTGDRGETSVGVRELQKCSLPSTSTYVPNLAFHFEDHHTRVDVAATLLSGARLNICLLQLAPTVPQAHDDASRPVAVNALRDLLAGGANHAQPALAEILPGAGPVLIVAPEFALGSGDWGAVDALVRAARRPLVLITGFGATAGQVVLDWQVGAVAGETVRHLSWRQDVNTISSAMRVNGGWCWLHEPGGTTHCITYLKNVLQQAYEAVVLDDLQTGETVLHLRFRDLDLLPLICADVVQPAAQSPASPQARIRAALSQVPADRPALIVGSLLQLGFSPNWAIAIDSLLNTVIAGRTGAVALCNVAYDTPDPDEDKDKWRSLSGVFAPFGELPKGQASLPAARALNAQGVVGAVVRQTHASVTAGLVAWPPYNPINGSFVWRGNMYCPILANGLVAPIVAAPDIAACEVARFLRRHPPEAGTAPRLATGIETIETQLGSSAPPKPADLLNTTLHGVSAAKPFQPDGLNDGEVTSALKAGLHAVATLKSIPGIEWQSSTERTGQLRLEAEDIHLLVWRSSTASRRAMKRDLATWRLHSANHPSLVVLGASRLGDLDDEEIDDQPRDDISMSPNSTATLDAGGSLAEVAGDITAARGRRRVVTLRLSHVADVYADYDAAADNARVTALLDRICGCFGQGARHD